MKTLAAPLIALVVIAGCNSAPDDSPDGLMKQSIAAMNELADGLEAGKTEDEMSPTSEKLDAIGKKLEALGLDAAAKDALIAKHKPELEKATERMIEAMMGSMQNAMKGAMQQMGDGMKDGMDNMEQQMGQQMDAAMEDMKQKMKLGQ